MNDGINYNPCPNAAQKPSDARYLYTTWLYSTWCPFYCNVTTKVPVKVGSFSAAIIVALCWKLMII